MSHNPVAWSPIWALPNVSVEEPFETTQAAIVGDGDTRLAEIAKKHDGMAKFLDCFSDEFGRKVNPSVLLMRADAPDQVRTVEALGGLRDLLCVSAIVDSHANFLNWKRPVGIPFSDSFDVYPWMVSKDCQRLVAITPAISGIHLIERLQAKRAPALAHTVLRQFDLDETLLTALKRRWEIRFAEGSEDLADLRLFRSIEMAKSAARMPGGSDSNIYDMGRSIALWVSAFEILAHDGRSDLVRVLELLRRVQWQSDKLRDNSHEVVYRRKTIETNLAGELYEKLYGVRNAFLHGNPVTAETINVRRCQRPILSFAAPLYRLALTSYLNIIFPTPPNLDDPEELGHFIADRMGFYDGQNNAEKAIMCADEDPSMDDD